MDFERFKVAQADSLNGFQVAIAELRKGQKRSHWIWYVFPQLRKLGRSSTAQFYGIENSADGLRYLNDPELASNLMIALKVVQDQLITGIPIEVLMNGYTDSLKLVSCCTLFKAITKPQEMPETGNKAALHDLCERILLEAERQGYGECSITRDAVRRG